MIQRICPICDQTMKSAHYCRKCHRWIKNPHVSDVGYYLNERHPAGETECTYHTAESRDTKSQNHSGKQEEPPYSKTVLWLLIAAGVICIVTWYVNWMATMFFGF